MPYITFAHSQTNKQQQAVVNKYASEMRDELLRGLQSAVGELDWGRGCLMLPSWATLAFELGELM